VPELSPIALVGWSGVAVLVASWLVVSLTSPGRRRDRAAWLGAVSLYVALGCLFLSLFLRSQAGGSWLGMIAFGFLLVFFASGLVLATHRLLRALAGRGPAGRLESATN
jgi:hypothetical protein